MQPSDARVLWLLIAFRLVNALGVRTFFQPDEYFQALEPGWRIAFGDDSGAWLTWEWQYQLRSSLHPAMFGGLYWAVQFVLQLLHASPHVSATLLVAAPKALQSIIAALGDYYTWKLARKIYGSSGGVASTALWLTVSNPWQWYCSTRTFSNSLETTLTIAALHYWPWHLLGDPSRHETDATRASQKHSPADLYISLLLAATAVILRPTNLIVWIAILTLTLTRLTLDGPSPITLGVLGSLIAGIFSCGVVVLALSILADRFFFGFWTFPPYNWLHFNLSQSLSIFYGRNDWHYYLSQGIPLLTTTFLPFALKGLWESTGLDTGSGPAAARSNAARTLSFAVFALVGTLSTISHKEVRFIYPLLPCLHVIAAPHVYQFFTVLEAAATPADRKSQSLARTPRLRRKGALAGALAANVLVGGYLSIFHQQAPISVTRFLREEFARLHPGELALETPRNPFGGEAAPLAPNGTTGARQGAERAPFVVFLTPCHSTPWRSHLVYPRLAARAISCEPPIHTEPGTRERHEYRDEGARFDADKVAFLDSELWPRDRPAKLPKYIVGFEGIEPDLARFFDKRDGPGARFGVEPRRVWEGWNGFFTDDSRRSGLLVVWNTGAEL